MFVYIFITYIFNFFKFCSLNSFFKIVIHCIVDGAIILWINTIIIIIIIIIIY